MPVRSAGRGTRLRHFGSPLLLALVASALPAAPCRAEAIRLDALTIPIVVSGPGGPQSVRLESIVLRPDDGQPHPLAVINHVSPRLESDRPKMSPYGLWAQAMEFARRGWVAVAFLRRGFGSSEGAWAESYGRCSDPDYTTTGRAGASDIAAVAKFMRAQSYVSKGKWISIGVSAGGLATVALTADAPPDLAAAISFAPGRGSIGPDTVCTEQHLVSAFAQYGRTSRIPLLWVSADNDHFFGPRLTAQLVTAFSDAGGKVSFVSTPPFGEDGHQLFSTKGIPVWSPIVDRFLKSNDLVLRDRPIEIPHSDVPVPFGLGAHGREAFKPYLESGPNKAFAAAGDGHFGWATARRSSDQAAKDALDFCASGGCAVVNVNDKPVK